METTTHPPVEEGVEADDLNTTTITMVGLISAALVLASALGVKALFETFVEINREEKVYQASYTEADSVLQQQELSLSGSPRAIPGQEGVYSLPIDNAMKIVVEELSAEQKE